MTILATGLGLAGALALALVMKRTRATNDDYRRALQEEALRAARDRKLAEQRRRRFYRPDYELNR